MNHKHVVGTAYSSGAPSVFSGARVARVGHCVVCCLSFDLLIPNTPLVISNSY
jgi:hypothetical protein